MDAIQCDILRWQKPMQDFVKINVDAGFDVVAGKELDWGGVSGTSLASCCKQI